MAAELIDGKGLAAKLNASLASKIAQLRKTPVLAVVLVGNNEASQIYVRNKQKAAKEVGIDTKLFELAADVSQIQLKQIITRLNGDDDIDAILIQLPLPKHIDSLEIINSIEPEKDVDGFTSYNAGMLAMNTGKGIVAATPKGVLAMIKTVCKDLSGKHAVIVGRSNIVGRPLASLLLNNDCTVTITHSKTRELNKITESADIVIAACGCARMIQKDWIKDGAIVIDVGINRIDGKLCGDVDFDNVKEKAAFISPVPFGVGPMTIASLLSNVYEIVSGKKS